jgi:hypothetical protein
MKNIDKNLLTEELLTRIIQKCLPKISPKRNFAEVIGESILLASIQASIGSVEMSSKFSVVNFSKDQRTLQAAADALTGYMIIGFVWMLGAMMILYAQHGIFGLLAAFISNSIMIGWIFFSYLHSFRMAVKRETLNFPNLWGMAYA